MGDISQAAKTMNEARELDLQDRFINTKCAKYYARACEFDAAEKTIVLFARVRAMGMTDYLFSKAHLRSKYWTWSRCNVCGLRSNAAMRIRA